MSDLFAEQDAKVTVVSNTNSPRPVTTPEPQKAEASFNISNEETIRRLRAKGQPIRLFGESDKDRRLRLRALELIEEKGHDRQAGQNDFKKALEDVENQEREMKNKNKGKKKDDSEFSAGGVLDLSLIKSDPDKLYPIIYYALRRTLKEWEEAMDERPGVFTDSYYWWRRLYFPPSRQYQTFDAGQTCGCNSSTICSISQTSLQSTSFTGSYTYLLSPLR
jgi:hypothetical protein